MRYRRATAPGGTYFFTVNLVDRSSRLLLDRVDDLRESVRVVKQRHPFEIVAWAVLPDHLHAVWTLPASDADFSSRWMLIKAAFSRRIGKGEFVRPSRIAKGERGLWQRRFWEHQIRDDNDLVRHVDYIHFNPVKHGYVNRASDWRHSSIHRYINAGEMPRDWAAAPDSDLLSGERA
ncbi:MAG: transposase [Nevskia sp.]|nr:transposase [Nevskia sp.]